MTTIDDITAALGKVDLLKMDIQGGEVLALMGAARSLATGLVRNWVVGTHSPQIHSACLAIFRKAGCTVAFEALRVEHQPDGLIIATAPS